MKTNKSDQILAENIGQSKETPMNATAKAFDQFIRDNDLYTNSRIIKEILLYKGLAVIHV